MYIRTIMAKEYLPYGMAKQRFKQSNPDQSYSQITAKDSKEVKALKAENTKLRSTIDSMNSEIKVLREEMQALKRVLENKADENSMPSTKDPQTSKVNTTHNVASVPGNRTIIAKQDLPNSMISDEGDISDPEPDVVTQSTPIDYSSGAKGANKRGASPSSEKN